MKLLIITCLSHFANLSSISDSDLLLEASVSAEVDPYSNWEKDFLEFWNSAENEAVSSTPHNPIFLYRHELVILVVLSGDISLSTSELCDRIPDCLSPEFVSSVDKIRSVFVNFVQVPDRVVFYQTTSGVADFTGLLNRAIEQFPEMNPKLLKLWFTFCPDPLYGAVFDGDSHWTMQQSTIRKLFSKLNIYY